MARYRLLVLLAILTFVAAAGYFAPQSADDGRNAVAVVLPTAAGAQIGGFDVSPGGDEIAFLSILTGYTNGPLHSVIEVRNLANPGSSEPFVTGQSTNPVGVWYSRSGASILLRTDNAIRIVDRKTESELGRVDCPPQLIQFDRSANGRWLAAWEIRDYFPGDGVTARPQVYLWNLETKSGPVKLPVADVDAVAFLPNNQQWVCAESNGRCTIRDLDGRVVDELPAKERTSDVMALRVSARGDILAMVSIHGIVQIWSLATKRRLAEFKAHDQVDWYQPAIALVANDKLLVTGGDDFHVRPRLLNSFPFVELHTFAQHSIKAWDSNTGTLIHTWRSEVPVGNILALPGSSDFFVREDHLRILRLRVP